MLFDCANFYYESWHFSAKRSDYLIIAICGNIGSGKTTLAKYLCQAYDYSYVPNHRSDLDFLNDFFENIPERFLQTQLSFLTNKATEIRILLAKGKNIVIDRSLEEDIQVFAKMWIDNYKIDERIIKLYLDASTYILNSIPSPDLYIMCDCSPEISKKRLEQREKRLFENKYPENHIEKIYDYLQYLQIPQNSFFIKISSEDNNFCDPLVLSEIINEIRHFMGYHLNTFKQRSIFSIIDETYDDYTTPPTCNYIKDYKIGKNTLSPHSLLYKKHYSIYLAAPFTSIANSEDKAVPEQQDYYQQLLIPSQRKHGTLPVKYQRILERIRKQIANSWNVDVILPHKDVNAWGKNELSSDIVLAKIVENINSCHGIVAIPSTSIGVHLEIGIAIAQQKPIIIFDIDELENSFYVSNFNVLNNIRTCHAAKISDIPKIINSHEELKDFMFSKGEIIL